VNRIDFMTPGEELTGVYGAGETLQVPQHDGTLMTLRKLHADYDPTDRWAAMSYMQQHAARGEVVTGLLYIDSLATDLHTALNTCAAPLNGLDHDKLCPGAATLQKINASLR
jgi:2-oxoglutarate ferredoxin oxidoreductase subunit beta